MLLLIQDFIQLWPTKERVNFFKKKTRQSSVRERNIWKDVKLL
jgi:hypothetical protein